MENYSKRFDNYEKNNPDKAMLSFFKDKIPKEDFEALKVSLFMRALFRDNENIFQVKRDVIKKFGDRGKNIANLCSSEYFENFIKPLYEEIDKSSMRKEETNEIFNNIYEMIIKNGLLAVFVNYGMSVRDIDIEVNRKIGESKKYGFYQISEVLYIHALSRKNVETLDEWIQGHNYDVRSATRGKWFLTISVPIDKN